MKVKILLILIIGVKLNECIDPKEFCINKEKVFQCRGEYSLNCGGVLCTKNEDSCQSLASFSSLKNIQKNPKDHAHHMKKFKSFLSSIKECTKFSYRMSKDVCLINKDCVNKINWLNLLKYDKCGKCSGKYSVRCNTDYCGLDKRACNGLKKNSINLEIKKCDNF